MIRKIYVVLILFILTGCSVDYQIKIDNDDISEKITLIETNQAIFDVVNDSGWTIRESFNSLINNSTNIFADQVMTVKSLSNDVQLGAEYSSTYAKSLINLAGINQCYEEPKIEVEGNIITLNTGSNFKCYDYYDNLESINVSLETSNKVISSNADYKKGNKYIWNITKDGNKQIIIAYDKSVNYKNIIIIYILIALGVIGVSYGVYYVYSKRKLENDI